MTPGQKQMVAIRDLIRAEMLADAQGWTYPQRDEVGTEPQGAFAKLCEAFGHEVPAE